MLASALVPDDDRGDDLASASLQDSSDCVKRLICELRTRSERSFAWDEALIMRAIPARIDYASPVIQLELAADLGKRSRSADQCGVVYSRCGFDAEQIMGLMRQRGTSLDLPTDENYGCTVLFLWHQKDQQE